MVLPVNGWAWQINELAIGKVCVTSTARFLHRSGRFKKGVSGERQRLPFYPPKSGDQL